MEQLNEWDCGQLTQSVNGAENSVTGCVDFRNWAWK